MLDLTQPWSALPLVVVDFETSGLDPATCSPVSVAAVRFEGGVEVASFYTLLKPDCAIPEEASAIHGITDDMVQDAPWLETVAGEILDVAYDALPVAYNAGYDRPILHRFINGLDCPMFDPAHLWLDPLVVIRTLDKYVSGKGRHKLETCCARWGVELDGAHNALADARATGRLLWRLHEKKKIRDYPAEQLLALIEERRLVQDAEFQAYLAKMERQANAAPPAEQLDLLTGTGGAK
jgi:DNA polymerase III epsilon subunit-like protein